MTRLFSTDLNEDDLEANMIRFGSGSLKFDLSPVLQRISKAENVYRATQRRPFGAPFARPIFDHSVEAAKQSKVRSIFYLMHASNFGMYYFWVLEPSTSCFWGVAALSAYLWFGFGLHQMKIMMSVAELQLRADGERVRIILYDGRIYEVPVAKLKWNKSGSDTAVVDTVDEVGRARRIMFDFSSVRPHQLLDLELCMAVLHPQVHRVAWTND